MFNVGDQVIMWWKPALTQGKFVLQRRGPYKVKAILGNGTYKLSNDHETLKALINSNLLKLYHDYCWMQLIIYVTSKDI